jgi:AraC-like DNA-binding protein
VFQDPQLGNGYDGFLFKADAVSLKRYQSHHHVVLELNIVVRGTVTYVIGGRRFTFSPRTLIWLFPDQEHQLVDLADNSQFYVVAFRRSLIERSCLSESNRYLKRTYTEQADILSTLLDPNSYDLVCKTMDSLSSDLDSESLNREAGFGAHSDFHFEHPDPDVLNAGLHFLLLFCWRCQLAGKSINQANSLHPSVHRALKTLNEDTNELSLEELSKICGTSKFHLSRTFRRQIGIPITQYRNSMRLSRFFEEYRKIDSKTLAEAAYAAGFGSYAEFYKVFTKAYGRGPKQSLARENSDPQVIDISRSSIDRSERSLHRKSVAQRKMNLIRPSKLA